MCKMKDDGSLKQEPRLRRGYTTGTCSAAAAKAAAAMLFSGEEVREVQLTVPAGETLRLEIVDIDASPDGVRCAVVKDAGDDPDVTGGMKVYAAVRRIPGGECAADGGEITSGSEGVVIDGGEGVGRVTKPGLDQPPGSAAINSVPRSMIRQAVEEEKQRFGESGGIEVVISIPGGEEIAKRTLNPALGIEGGLSVLGTSGIVEPMSEKALIDTIAVTIRQRLALGDRVLIMAPGNYGLAFLREKYGVPEERVVKISNYVGESLDIVVREAGGQYNNSPRKMEQVPVVLHAGHVGETGESASRHEFYYSSEEKEQVPVVLFAGHIGKLVKVAGGIMNTHSAVADRRMEILTEHAQRCGAGAEVLREIGDCVTTEAALDVLDQAGILAPVTESVVNSIQEQIGRRTGGALRTEVIMFSSIRGELAQTGGAKALLQRGAD